MIIDSVENLHKYAKEIPLLLDVVAIIDNTDFHSLKEGSYTTDNSAIRYVIFEYKLTKDHDVRYETHRIETDLQLVIRGKERFQIAWSSPVKIVEDYVPDVFFVTGSEAADIQLSENQFILLLPGEPHIPCLIADNDNTDVKKVVFKLTLPQ